MEPVTHILTGAVLARAGFNRRAAYATVAMLIAAELPDLDTLWSIAGPVTGFEHHRGITHTFIAIPFEAALVTGVVYAIYRLRKRPPTKAPANWTWLFLGTLTALLSHLLLDWTNNYGLRPFFPFNPRWYAGSFVFIFEPILFLILLAALIGPFLFGLINSEIGSNKPGFRGRPSAIAALLAIAALYVFRYDQRAEAMTVATQNAPRDMQRVFASPHPGNPFLWHMVTETPDSYQLSTVDSRRRIMVAANSSDTLYKAAATLPLLVAKRTELGRVYLDWSMFPILNELPASSTLDTDPNHPITQVTFSDARFMYDVSFMSGRQHPPLTGTVRLDMQAPEGQRVVETTMDGRPQR